MTGSFNKTKLLTTSSRLLLILFVTILFTAAPIQAQNPYERRKISRVDITFEGADKNVSAADQFRTIASRALGENYSTVKVRDAIAELYRTGRIISASVEASLVGEDQVSLRFLIRRKSVARRISVRVGNADGDTVTEQQVRLQLNLINPGTTFSERDLQENSNLILAYLRDRGFFNASVVTSQDAIGAEKEVEVIFDVEPGKQASINEIEFNINGFESEKLFQAIKLKKGALFTRNKVGEDLARVRDRLRKDGFLAPTILEPRIIYDDETNSIDVIMNGQVGAKIDVIVDSEEEKVGEKTQTRLLPVKRDGTVDYSAIVEGQRRLETYYQERGYFFARVSPVCAVNPAFGANEASSITNGTEELMLGNVRG